MKERGELTTIGGGGSQLSVADVGGKTNNSFMKNYDFDSNLTTNREF